MKKTAVIVAAFFALLLVIGTRIHAPYANAGEPVDKAGGRWLLHEYHDRIMNNRCIGEFSFNEAVWSAILVQVTSDSVIVNGSIFERRAFPRQQGDTLATIPGISGAPLSLHYAAKNKELQITFPLEGKTVVFHYRRLRSVELHTLTRGGNISSSRWQFRDNYNALFRKEFFSGTFTGADGKAFTISDEGVVKKFGNWNAVWIDDFFGTSHWTGKKDRVRFEDSTNTGSFQDYNWRYKGDTLILRKYLGPDIEQYTLSKDEERYIRTPMK